MRSQRRLGGLRLKSDLDRCSLADCYRKRVPLHTAQRFSPSKIKTRARRYLPTCVPAGKTVFPREPDTLNSAARSNIPDAGQAYASRYR